MEAVEQYLGKYLILDGTLILVIAVWVIAAWLSDIWDRFAHLVITSPGRRCGKTRALELLALITPNAHSTTSISPAAMYRKIEQSDPKATVLIDEAQSLNRRGSESSELTRELLNAGIDRNAIVSRCGGKKMDKVIEFHIGT